MFRRTNQGGSVASFVVIGVILVVGLVSAVYFLNQRGQQARKDQTIAASKNQATKPNVTNPTVPATNKTTPSPSGNSTTKSKASNLPATGIELSIVEFASVFSLTASIVAYVLSRRMLEHSL
jgi:hypothetical protein